MKSKFDTIMQIQAEIEQRQRRDIKRIIWACLITGLLFALFFMGIFQ